MNVRARMDTDQEKSAAGEAARSGLTGSGLRAILARVAAFATAHRRERRLRLCEMISLGEKRFLAVVEFGEEEFLLAGTPQNIVLLQKFERNEEPRNGAGNGAENGARARL